MSKEVLPQETRQISEESPGIHTDQSHQNQLYKMTNVHMLIMLYLCSKTYTIIVSLQYMDGKLMIQKSNLPYSHKVYI